jgi:hypothetical protein
MECIARRRIVAVLTVTLVLIGLPAAADASSVAYIDKGEVWVASLDGKKKVRVSGGEGDWNDVAASDGGRIAGSRNTPGYISSFSNFQVWESSGKLAHFGALSASSGWSSYTYPLSFDISADGLILVYGFSNTRLGAGALLEFDRGFYWRTVDNASLPPIRIGGETYPTLFGTRVVSQGNHRTRLQDPASPISDVFADWLDTSVVANTDLHRTDVAANGQLVAFELVASSGPGQWILAASVNGLGGGLTGAVECYLPTDGEATSVSISQDASHIAWKDSGGVKVAGAPTGTAEFCGLTSPPAVISATGSYPSIGGANIAGFLPLSAAFPSKLAVSALAKAKGVALTVSAPAGGKIACKGTVPASRLGGKGSKKVVVATCSATAAQAGELTVKLRLNAVGRKAAAKLRGGKLALKVTQGKASVSKTIALR